MHSKFLLLCFLLLSFTLQAQSDCAEGESEITVNLLTDNYPNETTWTLIGADGNTYLSGGPYDSQDSLFTQTACAPTGLCLTFTIEDSYGDGICCGFGEGYFELVVDGNLVTEGGDFNNSETVLINCPPGSECSSPLTAALGANTAEVDFNSTWYVFTTDNTGMYNINTCDEANTCNTTIWVYDYCAGLDWNNTNEATYSFNEDFCGEQSQVTLALGAGETYYIRIGSATEDCNQQNVNFSITYEGPIMGCTDPLACNYDPLASGDDGTCIYPGDPDCPTGPDLIVLQEVFINSLYIDYIDNTDGCLIEESCVSGYGQRELLRFTTHIDNIGEADYYIGQPQEGSDQFEYDVCHNHWHYEGYANYLIFDDNGEALPQGFKNGFCVLDLTCDWGTAQYGCGNMGISAGCGDIYGSGLECQWFDITELPAGDYTFAIAVNWDHDPDALGQHEMTYENNWAQVCLRITREEITNNASFEVLEDCEPYVDCAGVAYGNAVPDCTGECNGSALMADLDASGERDSDDVTLYISEALSDNPGTACNDLNGDGQISVTDILLGLECVLHEGQGPQPGHNHTPCDFPFNILNETHTVLLGVDNLNTEEGYFDITIQNPFNKVSGFEFEIEGAIIESITPMLLDWSHDLHHDDTEIIGFSWDEDVLEKSESLLTMARVYYSELTGSEVCIGEITAVVNGANEETNHVATTCAEVVSSTEATLPNDYHAVAYPNPTSDNLTILFDYATGETVDVRVTDLTGRVVFTEKAVRSHRLGINVNSWSAGIYNYEVRGARGVSIGKVLVE